MYNPIFIVILLVFLCQATFLAWINLAEQLLASHKEETYKEETFKDIRHVHQGDNKCALHTSANFWERYER